MKKFFEKHDLVKISLIMILITIVLSWVVKQGYFNAGELSVGDITRVGLFDVVTYGLLGMYYFTVLVTFLFVVGAFYQFLSKIGAYQKLTDKIAKRVKGKEILFSLIISFIFAALASMLNEYMVLVAFMPFIITICSKAKMDKISSFVMTFGAMLVGILGSTIGQKVVGMNVQFFQLQFTDSLLVKIIIFALAFILYSLFNVLYLMNGTNTIVKSENKKVAKKAENKKNKEFKAKKDDINVLVITLSFTALFIFAIFANMYTFVMNIYLGFILLTTVLMIVSLVYIFKKAGEPWWAVFIPVYGNIVLFKIAGFKWYYIILNCIPILNIYIGFKLGIELAAKFKQSKAFGVGLVLVSYIYYPILAFGKSKYSAQASKKSSEVEQVKEGKIANICTDLFENEIKDNEKSNIIPLLIVSILSIITVILAYLPWVNVFKLDWFTKALKAVTEVEVFGKPIFSYILGNVAEFGSWDLFGIQVVMILAMLVLAICYKKGLTDIIDSFAEGFKKTGKLVAMLLLAYVILEFAVMYPVIPTIIGNILGKSFNVFTTAISALITSLFTSEYQYAINIVYSYASSVYASDLKVFAIIFQAIYGLVSFFAPSSAMLLVGLSYLNIPYKDWMKYIWKFLVAMFVVIIVVALIIA